jgi:hypothetical protein
MNRRDYIRNTLLKNGPELSIAEPKDGEIIKVFSSTVTVPDTLKSGSASKKRVTIYFPTLFQIDRFNMANIFEAALCPAVVDGKIDYFLLIKAEGLNNLAYKKSDGTPIGEEKVAEAAVSRIFDIFNKKLNLNKSNCLIDIGAYSEGVPQAVATAYKLHSLGFEIRQVVSVCGAGIIGADSQESANPVLHTLSTIIKMFKNRKITLNQSIYDLKSLVAPLYEGQDDQALGEWNVNFWARRYIFTQLGLNKLLKMDGVPIERLKVAVTKSPYFKKIAGAHIPMVFFDAKRDIFFDNQAMRRNIDDLKKINPNIIEITSNVLHWYAHEHPTMIAQAIVKAEKELGWK